MENQREQFEAWVTQQPSGQSIERYGDDHCNNILHGRYRDYSVDLAWLAWQKATEVASSELLEVLESVVDESAVVTSNAKYDTIQISHGVLDEVREAIKKASDE